MQKVKKILVFYGKYKRKISALENLLKHEQILIKQSVKFGVLFSNNYEFKSDIEKIEEIKMQINKKIGQMEEVCERIETSVSMLEQPLRKIIELRYFDKTSWSNIAKLNKKSLVYIFKLHSLALKELEVHFNKNLFI